MLPDHLQQRLEQAARLRAQGPRGRYAPSPTGPQHLGNLRTALLSWLIARLQGGEWLLRIDDLDTPRNRPGAEAAILADLTWLGLAWDGPPLRQSERRGLYATVLSSLRRAGCLYPCRCSRRLLADISAPHGATPVYPGICRGKPPAWGPQQGRLPSWRLALGPGVLAWQERLGPLGRRDAAGEVGDVVPITHSTPGWTAKPFRILQIELKDTKSARKTLDDLQKAYPGSEAAKAAKERAAGLR